MGNAPFLQQDRGISQHWAFPGILTTGRQETRAQGERYPGWGSQPLWSLVSTTWCHFWLRALGFPVHSVSIYSSTYDTKKNLMVDIYLSEMGKIISSTAKKSIW